MGCFESKDKQKSKAIPITFRSVSLGHFNNRWKRSLSIDDLKLTIVTDTHGVAEHPAFRCIEKDITRTFPDQQFFKNSSNLDIFRDTLKCFALTFPRLGYTQGLNFLTGFLLLNKFTKSQTLKILASICVNQQMMCLGFYEDDFPLAYLYCRLFWKILEQKDNQLFKCLKSYEIPDEMWIFQWYITFFLYSFPLEYIPYFFNTIFDIQPFGIVKLALGIVMALKNELLGLQQKDQGGFIEFLDNLKDYQKCLKVLRLDDILKYVSEIKDEKIQQALQKIKQSAAIKNFYINYFCSIKRQRDSLYELYIGQIEHRTIQLSNSKHDSNLMQSFKRLQQKVQILDEILIASVKRQRDKKYRSNLDGIMNVGLKKELLKGWRSEAAIFEQDAKNQDETTISVVRKMIIKDD